MNPTRFALAALGFTCVAAAAGGGYLATRQNAAVQPAAAATVATTAPAPDAATAAVPETEAIVGDVKPADVAAPRDGQRAAGSTPRFVVATGASRRNVLRADNVAARLCLAGQRPFGVPDGNNPAATATAKRPGRGQRER